MIGCSFVVDREYFADIGLLDPGMEVYGGENIELGMRVSGATRGPQTCPGNGCANRLGAACGVSVRSHTAWGTVLCLLHCKRHSLWSAHGAAGRLETFQAAPSAQGTECLPWDHCPRAVPAAVHGVWVHLSWTCKAGVPVWVVGTGGPMAAPGGRGGSSCRGPRQDWAPGAPRGRAWGCMARGTSEGGHQPRSMSPGPHPSHLLPGTLGAPPGFKLPHLATWRTNRKFWKNLGCKSGSLGWQSSSLLGARS